MKRVVIGCLIYFLMLSPSVADDRNVIQVPIEIKEMFLEDMRRHLDNLNEITYAVSAGDFAGAAYVAENKMGFGHSVREMLMAKGMPEHEINDFVTNLRQKHGEGERPAQGIGRYMPQEFREMGQTFHQAAGEFAKIAKSVSTSPTVEDYQQVFSALSEVVDVCSACHSAFRVQ